jgi:hypothetical protein
MVFRFLAYQVREQITHAQSARLRCSHGETRELIDPSLVLTRMDGRVFLISNGVPESQHPAYALGFGASEPIDGHAWSDVAAAAKTAHAQLDADDDIGPGDFAEGISVTAFERTLKDTCISIVVRRTYINVLGGRPFRALAPAPAGRDRHGMQLILGANVGAVRQMPKKPH